MQGFPGLEGMVAFTVIARVQGFFGGCGGDGNVLKLDVVMVAQLQIHQKPLDCTIYMGKSQRL